MSACPAVKDRSSTRSSKSTERNPTAEQYTMRSEFCRIQRFNSLEGRNGFHFKSPIAAVFWLYLQQTAYMTELPLLDIECLTNCSEPIG